LAPAAEFSHSWHGAELADRHPVLSGASEKSKAIHALDCIIKARSVLSPADLEFLSERAIQRWSNPASHYVTALKSHRGIVPRPAFRMLCALRMDLSAGVVRVGVGRCDAERPVEAHDAAARFALALAEGDDGAISPGY